uniref:G-protein coupled receptors family 1 profile domain-containing protein n=1 Tax=Meloidogyne floridensis TaxID=298350 RepID=A0A915NLP0_9BILA
MSNVLDINTYNNSKNGNTSSIIILSEHSQQQEQKQEKCLEMEALFSGLNNFFRDDDILKESEHSSELLGNLIFTAYLLVIAFGSIGNLLTIMARTVRNFFILNLALSDFFVCTVTAPTTLMINKEAYTVGVIILQYLLPLASIAFAYSRIARRMGTRRSCRYANGGRDSRKNSVFLVNILVINTPVFGSNRSSFCRQIASGGATSPFIASDNGHKHSSNKQPLVISTNGEYSQTNGNLQNVNPSAEILLKQRRKSIADRHRRTNMLLVTLVVVFACAWLPLNIFHAYTLLFNKLSKTASFSVPIFALCHLTAMCSACLNPCCYAFFNNNFRQEFLAMYRKLGLTTLYRCFVRFTKRLCPSTEISKEKSVNATQINENKELGTLPSENEANQHLQQTIQGVPKNITEECSPS